MIREEIILPRILPPIPEGARRPDEGGRYQPRTIPRSECATPKRASRGQRPDAGGAGSDRFGNLTHVPIVPASRKPHRNRLRLEAVPRRDPSAPDDTQATNQPSSPERPRPPARAHRGREVAATL